MSTLAGKTRFALEPKMPVDLSAVATTQTPDVLQPSLGPLAILSYKPSRFAYNLKTDGATLSAVVTVRLMAGAATIYSASHNLNGVIEIGDSVPVDMSQVSGETQLRAEVEVTTSEASRTATLDAFIDVESPAVLTGC